MDTTLTQADTPKEPQLTADARSLALARYGQVLGYMQYESNVFWTRSQHFLTAHAFLFGFVLSNLPVGASPVSWARLYTLIVACGGGIVLAHLWRQALKAGAYWLGHWTDILRELEPAAYEALLVHRPFPVKPGYVRATGVAHKTAYLFLVLWGLASLYLVSLLLGKICGLQVL